MKEDADNARMRMYSFDRDETQETIVQGQDVSSQRGFENDDRLTIRIDGKEHLVDSIV